MRELRCREFRDALDLARRFRNDRSTSDVDLVRAVAVWLASAAGPAGLLAALASAVAKLTRVVLAPPGACGPRDAWRDVARGALRYLLCPQDRIPDHLRADGLTDDFWVARDGVRDLHRAGAASLFQLSESETRQIDDALLAAAGWAGEEDLDQLRNWLAFRRAEAAKYAGAPEADRALAWIEPAEDALRAWTSPVGAMISRAIRYLAGTGRQLPVDLGPASLLEDARALAVVCQLPASGVGRTWQYVDEAQAAMPFLQRMLLGSVEGPAPVSPFIMASALQVAAVANESPMALVAPGAEQLPLLLAVTTALARIERRAVHEEISAELPIGSHVAIGGIRGVYNVAGYPDFDGQRMIKLTGRVPGFALSLPARPEYLRQLIPVGERRVTGERRALMQHDWGLLVDTVDQILNADTPVRFDKLGTCVVLLDEIGSTRRLASSLHIGGRPLRDLFPMGSLDEGGVPQNWSGRWSGLRPIVVIEPRPLRAAEWIATNCEEKPVVVMAASRSRAKQTAELMEVMSRAAGVAAVVSPADAHAADSLRTARFTLREWPRESLRALSPRISMNGAHGHLTDSPLAALHEEIRLSARAEILHEVVALPESDGAFQAVERLSRLDSTDWFGTEDDLDRARATAGAVLYRLLETVPPLSGCPLMADWIGQRIAQVRQIAKPAEVGPAGADCLRSVADALAALLAAVTPANPKAGLVGQIAATVPRASLVVRDDSVTDEAVRWLRSIASGWKICRASDVIVAEPQSCIVLAGWLGRERMARLLRVPRAESVRVLLFSAEQRAFERTRRMWARESASRAILPPAADWDGAATLSDTNTADDGTERLDVLRDKLRQLAQDRLLRRVTAIGNGDAVEARLFVFDDGSMALLTEDYAARVVTHLVDEALNPTGSAPSSSKVIECERDAVEVGAYLLFRHGGASDAIRELADQILGADSASTRATAALWRDALRRQVVDEGLPFAELCTRLSAAGLHRMPSTVRGWVYGNWTIAPHGDQSIEQIANATGDMSLKRGLQNCRAAVSRIRSAHLSAALELARRVMASFERTGLSSVRLEATSGRIELDGGLTIARVSSIGTDTVRVAPRDVNRLLDGAGL